MSNYRTLILGLIFAFMLPTLATAQTELELRTDVEQLSKEIGDLERQLEVKGQEIDDLERQIESKEKDYWDKIEASSGLATGILVAIFGGIATHFYRQREHRISKVQIMQAMIPYLSSKEDPRVREAALLGIGILDDGDLLNKVADIFQDVPSAVAKARFANARNSKSFDKESTVPKRASEIMDFIIGGLPKDQLNFLEWLASSNKSLVSLDEVPHELLGDVEILIRQGLLVRNGDYISFPHLLIKERIKELIAERYS